MITWGGSIGRASRAVETGGEVCEIGLNENSCPLINEIQFCGAATKLFIEAKQAVTRRKALHRGIIKLRIRPAPDTMMSAVAMDVIQADYNSGIGHKSKKVEKAVVPACYADL